VLYTAFQPAVNLQSRNGTAVLALKKIFSLHVFGTVVWPLSTPGSANPAPGDSAANERFCFASKQSVSLRRNCSSQSAVTSSREEYSEKNIGEYASAATKKPTEEASLGIFVIFSSSKSFVRAKRSRRERQACLLPSVRQMASHVVIDARPVASTGWVCVSALRRLPIPWFSVKQRLLDYPRQAP
jgi:hypothetical protein